MSQFGQRALADAGVDAMFVPHGVNTMVFRPWPGDRRDVRELTGIPRDAFVVGMVAANQGNNPPRKAFPQAFQAFAEFHKRHPDALLHLHTDIHGRNMGLNLLDLASAVGLPHGAIGSSDDLMVRLGFVGSQDMAAIYSGYDVLLNASYGEGFGIPILEAQACGTPVITTDCTAMPELTGAGWKVKGDPWWDPMHSAWFTAPRVGDIVDALEEAYRHAEKLRGRAREFAVLYDADTITKEMWMPVIEELGKPVEVPALPNRAARRSAKKKKVAA